MPRERGRTEATVGQQATIKPRPGAACVASNVQRVAAIDVQKCQRLLPVHVLDDWPLAIEHRVGCGPISQAGGHEASPREYVAQLVLVVRFAGKLDATVGEFERATYQACPVVGVRQAGARLGRFDEVTFIQRRLEGDLEQRQPGGQIIADDVQPTERARPAVA